MILSLSKVIVVVRGLML